MTDWVKREEPETGGGKGAVLNEEDRWGELQGWWLKTHKIQILRCGELIQKILSVYRLQLYALRDCGCKNEPASSKEQEELTRAANYYFFFGLIIFMFILA